MRCFGNAGIAGISASITRTRKPISTCKVARFAATKLFPAEGIGPITIRRLLRACAGWLSPPRPRSDAPRPEVWYANRAQRTLVLSATATLLQPFWLHCQQTEYRLQFAETND